MANRHCIIDLINITSGNGLSPILRQSVNLTNDDVLFIEPAGRRFIRISPHHTAVDIQVSLQNIGRLASGKCVVCVWGWGGGGGGGGGVGGGWGGGGGGIRTLWHHYSRIQVS